MSDVATNPRRELVLPAEDTMYLDASFPGWETVRDGHAAWLIIPDYPIPDGYNLTEVSAALRLERGYPDTPIDMVYFHPPLSRADGTMIKATGATKIIAGESYQRWSRHRTRSNPWRPGIDGIETQMLLVRDWLEREFKV